MATETFSTEYDASANLYLRLFDETGQVFDFNDNTFKALASATTPYAAATERADMAGTGRSGYTVAVNLANVWGAGNPKRLVAKFYDNAAPADADAPVSEPLGLTVQFGQLGEGHLVCHAEVAVKSTAGSTAQLSVWLERNGQTVDIDGADASASATLTLTEHDGLELFSKSFVAADINDDVFEAEQATPSFTDDRIYRAKIEITENGNTWTTHAAIAVIG